MLRIVTAFGQNMSCNEFKSSFEKKQHCISSFRVKKNMVCLLFLHLKLSLVFLLSQNLIHQMDSLLELILPTCWQLFFLQSDLFEGLGDESYSGGTPGSARRSVKKLVIRSSPAVGGASSTSRHTTGPHQSAFSSPSLYSSGRHR